MANIKKELKILQKDILDFQFDLAKQSEQLNQTLLPVFLQQIGLEPTFDEAGNVIGAEEAPLSEDAQRRKDLAESIELGFLERTEAALKGELPVNPALMSDLADQEEQLRARLRQQLGSGFETSTPGIEALAQFAEDRTNILEGARRGDLTLAEQLGISRGTFNTAQQQTGLQNILGATGFNQATSGLFGQAGATGSNLMGNIAQFKQINAARGSGGGEFAAGLGSLAGTIGGAYASSATGSAAIANLFSDRRLKANIEPLGKDETGLMVYEFDYLWGEHAVGYMADEVLKKYPDAVSEHESGYLMVDYSRVH